MNKRKRAEEKKRIEEREYGDFRIWFNDPSDITQGCRIRSPSGSRYHIPSDEEIRERYRQDLTDGGKLSSTVHGWINRRGVLISGNRDSAAARKVLGLPDLISRVTEEEITKAIKEFWPEEEVRKAMEGEDAELRGINDFRKKEAHNREYQGARGMYRDFKTILERVYPGAYEVISKHPKIREYGRKIDVEKLGKDLLKRFIQGEPINRRSLEYAPDDSKEKRLFLDVLHVARERGDLFRKRKKGGILLLWLS